MFSRLSGHVFAFIWFQSEAQLFFTDLPVATAAADALPAAHLSPPLPQNVSTVVADVPTK